jgi:hemoglobin
MTGSVGKDDHSDGRHLRSSVAGDARVNTKFAKTNIRALKPSFDQVCALGGGPCQYTGRSMKEAHPT